MKRGENMRKIEVTGEEYKLIRLALANLWSHLKEEGDDEKMEAIAELEMSLSNNNVEYRAVLHNPKNGNKVVESLWFESRDKAERTGKTGLDFFGGTHYTIEEQSI